MDSPLVGSPAPEFSCTADGRDYTIADFRGTPVIVAFASRMAAPQPVLQHLAFDGERLPVVTPTDDRVARLYGVHARTAVFVIGTAGDVVWHDAVSAARELTRREFVASMLAASIAASLGQTVEASAGAPADTVDVECHVNGRPDHVGGRAARRALRSGRRRRSRAHERQSVSLRRLQRDRGRRPVGARPRELT